MIHNSASFPSVTFHNANIDGPQVEQSIPIHLLESLKANPNLKDKKKLEKDFKILSADQLSSVIEEFCVHIAQQENSLDLIKIMQQLATIIPYQKLEEAIQVKHPNHIDALHTAKSLLKKAQNYLALTEEKSMPLVVKFQKVLDAMMTCLESVLTAFGIADFFRPLENGVQPHTKAQRIFSLISLFGILTAALLPLLGAAVTAPIVGGVLLTLAALSLIYPHIKPRPHRMPKATNWSKQIREGKLQVAEINKYYLDQIAKTLTGKVKTHPILIGKSGIGKTETAKAFAKAVENGTYPELKGKTVFYINSADLINAHGAQDAGNKDLQRISEVMGRHRKDIILIFDEIHVLCQMKHNVIAEQLKTFLDGSHEGFPYVIGITTQQEFYRDIFRNNAAFARRFKEITIKNPQDEEVITILKKILAQKDPLALVDDVAIESLLYEVKKAFPNEAQPAAAIKILSLCLKEISENQKTDLENQIEEIRQNIDQLNAETEVGEGNGLLPNVQVNRNQIQILEAELAKLEESFKDYQKEVEQFYRTREKFGIIKKQGFKNVTKISKLAGKLNGKDERLLNEYLLESYFLAGALESSIRQKAERLNIKTVINSSLIQKVIETEIENQIKVKQAVEAGKEDLNARNSGFDKAADD